MSNKNVAVTSSYSRQPQAKKDVMNARRRARRSEKRKRDNNDLITIPIQQDNSLYDIFSSVISTKNQDPKQKCHVDIPGIDHTWETCIIGISNNHTLGNFIVICVKKKLMI